MTATAPEQQATIPANVLDQVARFVALGLRRDAAAEDANRNETTRTK